MTSPNFSGQRIFTEAQAELYDLVLSAQAEAIDAMVVGKSIKSFHKAALRRLTEGLIDLKIIEGPLKSRSKKRYATYYMHGTGHFRIGRARRRCMRSTEAD